MRSESFEEGRECHPAGTDNHTNNRGLEKIVS